MASGQYGTVHRLIFINQNLTNNKELHGEVPMAYVANVLECNILVNEFKLQLHSLLN